MSSSGLSLINDLNKLKSKLTDMDKDIRFQSKNILVRDKYWDEMQDSLKHTIEVNAKRDKIVIDCGGKLFTTSKTTLLKAKNSLFEAIVLDPEFDLSQELFFDRSPEYFTPIFEYIRSGSINYKLFSKEQKKKLLEEAKYYQVLDIVEYLEERLKDIELVSYEFTGPYIYKGKTAGTNVIEDLSKEDISDGAICCTSPGCITFTLNSDWDIYEIKIGGYKGDNKLWYPENGSGANISTSEDGKQWKKVGKIPSGYGKEIKSIKLSKSTGRYIKFSHTSYLGIGYLKIIKQEDDE